VTVPVHHLLQHLTQSTGFRSRLFGGQMLGHMGAQVNDSVARTVSCDSCHEWCCGICKEYFTTAL